MPGPATFPMRFIIPAVLSTAAATLCIAFLAVRAASAPEKPAASEADEHVTTLTKDNFDEFIKGNLTLVEFYAPWCKHCKDLMPHYEKAAADLKALDIKLGKIDCETNREICTDPKMNIKGYPTLKVFRNSEAEEYTGPREHLGIVSYMKKQASPPTSNLEASAVDNFRAQNVNETVLISYSKRGSSEDKTFRIVAGKMRNEFVFGQVESTPASVVMYKKDAERISYTGNLTDEKELAHFIKIESMPLLDEIGPGNYAKYTEAGIPLGYFFYNDESQKKTFGPVIETAIKKVRGKLNTVLINAQTFGRHAEHLSLKQEWPAFVIHDMEQDRKFPFLQTDKLTPEKLGKFIDDFAANKLKPFFKSEPVSTKDDGNVKVVVHDTFDKIVNDPTKDVLVEFYAPWCGHCKSLAPIYEKLAEKFAKHSNKFVIAKFNAVTNDLPEGIGFKVEGYPTIKLVTAKNNTVIDFDGERTLSELFEFMQKNAVNKVDFKLTPEEMGIEKDGKTTGPKDKEEL